MHPNRTLNSVFVLLLLAFNSYSQSIAKTLLWRISGHGLTKPSYLYGTMHLSDKRLFAFGDSVYRAIEKSDGLAIEVNPDEMAAYTVNQLFDQLEKTKKLQDILKDKDFNKYSAALEKKFKKPAKEITTSDVVREKNKWMSEYMEKGEMPTFLDAYLYNIARRQGKWLGGVEDMSDQAGLLEDMVDKSDIDYLLAGETSHTSATRDEYMERMIEIYNNGDLASLDVMINGQSSAEQRDRILIRRNVKMARRIDSLTQLRTMFVAVGAAHLPGDSGVIDLLRKRGFSVEPVFASKKINEPDYIVKEARVPWFPVDDSHGLYTTLMPGNPATIKLYGLIEMKFLLDIFNMSSYCSMAAVNTSELTNIDSVSNAMALRMFQTKHPPTARIISNNGIEGREYIQEKKGANIRLQVFIYHRTIYVSFMSGMKPATLNAEDAGKFFASFKINKEISTQKTTTVFADPIMGISFTAPAKIEYNRKLSNDTANGWKMSAFTGTDISSGTYFLVYSKEVKPGHYILADSLLKGELDNNLKKQYGNVRIGDTWLQGYQMQSITGRNILQPSLYMHAVNLIKNGRDIFILAIGDSVHAYSAGVDSLFASLHFIDPPAVNWQLAAPAGNFFSAFVPGTLRPEISGSGKQQWYAYDTTTSLSYYIIPDTLSKYFGVGSDSVYWKYVVKASAQSDSVIAQTMVNNGKLKGVELLLKDRQSINMYKRMRLLQDSSVLYKMFLCAEKDFVGNENSDKFFSSFSVSRPSADSQFITRSKINLLLADLTRDSATRQAAYNALGDIETTKADRALLQDALFKKYYTWYDSTESDEINYKIGTHLAKLHEPAVIDFVAARYNNFTERSDTLKNISLALLAGMHTRESYAALAKLLQQAPPHASFDYTFSNSLKDSLSLTATIYAVLQQLAADTLHVCRIAGIATTLIDSGFINIDAVRPAEHDFDKAAMTLLPALQRSTQAGYQVYQLLPLLGKLKSAASNKVLQYYLSVKSAWLRKAAVMELVKNDQPVAAAVLTGLAADKYIRSSFYNGLKEAKKASLFPAQYLTQAYFAEAAVADAASDFDDYSINSIRFIEKKTATYNGKQCVFYLYKVVMEEDDSVSSYLGIAGGYALHGSALQPAANASGVYMGEGFDAKRVGVLLKAYLEDLEKNESDDETELKKTL